MLNIVDPKSMLFVMYSSPIPIEKLSNDTKNENMIMFINDKLLSSLCSFNDFIISISIISNTVISMYFELTCIISVSTCPIREPSIGIMKWNIPTDMEVVIIVFFGMLIRPYAKDRVNASILNDNPIIINVIIFKKCHLLNYSDIC